MPYRTLIQPEELHRLMQAPTHEVLLFDLSFDLTDPGAGRRSFAVGHLPGARYLSLEEDLSGPKTGRNGRHPLPDRADFVRRMAALGVHGERQVVAYDQAGGMYAARLWWMLRWIGHAHVAVLDGGLPTWKVLGLPLEAGEAQPHSGADGSPSQPVLRPALQPTVDRNALLQNLQDRRLTVVDARSPDRFWGENETLDPIGGRIPGALNRFFKDNLGPEGRFKTAEALRAEFLALLGDKPAQALVMQCGSGVTACHNLVAMAHAGLEGAALYPGSWSEWSAWPDAPVATGPA